MVKAINAADYEGLRKDFNKTMLDAFPIATCRTFFGKEISDKFGKITRLDPPRFKSAAEAVFVARCDRGTLNFTLILDEQGQVAGMLFRPGSNRPIPDKNQTKLALPFNGRWLVLWGGGTAELNQHHDLGAQCFAFDLLGVGPDGKTHKGNGSRNVDYYAFGREVLAPADGVVTDVIDGVRDNVPGSMNPLSALGNAIFIQHSKREVSVLAHFKQASIKVKAGDTVKKGQVLGLCGNSGNSSEPHIHYHLQSTPVIQDATGIECFFEELVVEKESAKSTKRKYSPLKADIISPVSNKK
jgi:murein DD-endopeptidase MepM/ murein hydrolase activator NlpD